MDTPQNKPPNDRLEAILESLGEISPDEKPIILGSTKIWKKGEPDNPDPCIYQPEEKHEDYTP